MPDSGSDHSSPNNSASKSVVELLAIGELAARTGVANSALRYYEELGLLTPTARVGGQRHYDAASVQLVGVILLLRDLGFTLKEIAQLLAGRAESLTAWRALAERKITELDHQIADADVARTAIEHSLQCPRDDILDCPNFWQVVGGRLAGRDLAAAHTGGMPESRSAG